MQGITVPDAYKHLLPKKYGRTDDYKPALQRYIEKNRDRVITGKDFQEALETATAVVHVKKLMKQGYITRRRKKSKRGHAFTYEWNTMPLDGRTAALTNGEVVTTTLNLPEYPIDHSSLTKLPELIAEWFDKQQPSAEQTAGALIFRKYLEDKYKQVDSDRREKLETL